MYDVKLVEVPSGRMHSVNGLNEPILGADGKPETEYVLAAIVEGHLVPLNSYSVGFVEHQVGRPDTAIDESASSSTAAPATDAPAAPVPAEGSGTAGEGAAAAPAAEPPAG